MAKFRKVARAVDQGFQTIRLDPSGDLLREAKRQSRQPSSTTVAEKRVKSAAVRSYRVLTPGR